MSRTAELVAEFVPLNRRRLSGSPPLTAPELQRWSELRDLLAWEFGHRPPLQGGVDRPLRVPSHLKVGYGEGSVATVRNLSEGGLFVETGSLPGPGTALALQIDPGDGTPPLGVEVVVVWEREIANRDGPAGFGAAFHDLEPDLLPTLVCLIEQVLREAAAS